ncbi:helix-turn-helix domain-containing protein [Micromonospora sp. NPDC050200]|uniref:helix-turn-helix domain-containing protein n=1 Tax=Micromonospora sp. NPDC050200 TaxID=3155664 RepID=UPI0033DD2E01
MDYGEQHIAQITDPAAFVAAMRALKERSGLTYRQLEQRATGNGDVLARSTVADILRRSTLPRPEVLAAFVRACGQGEQVTTWLRARDRLATAALVPPPATAPSVAAGQPGAAPTGTGTGTGDAVGPSAAGSARVAAPPAGALRGGANPGRRPRARPVVLALGAVALAVTGAGVWLTRPSSAPAGSAGERGSDGTPAVAAGTPGPIAGRVRIRPARTPQFCLSEGRDPTGAYPHEIAVQRPCGGSTPPETYLEPAGGHLHFIRWEHPVKGPGCLTVRGDSPGMFLLEPWDDCRAERSTQVFRFEPQPGDPGAYRIRSGREGLCVGIRDDATDASAAALIEPCTGGPDQEFLVDRLGPAGGAAG